MTLWKEIMELEKLDNRHKGCANTLTVDDIDTILCTFDYFGASDNTLRQIMFDLSIARYRVFDWLAMFINGRYGDDFGVESGVKVVAYALKKCQGNVTNFIIDLQETDYDMIRDWEDLTLE